MEQIVRFQLYIVPSTANSLSQSSTILIVLPVEPEEPSSFFNPIGSKPTVCAFGSKPQHIVTGHESGKVAIFDAKTGDEIMSNERAHGDVVTDLQLSPDRTYFITSSKDKIARVRNFIRSHVPCIHADCLCE